MVKRSASSTHGNRRSRYLDVALRLFLEQGFNGVSIDEVVAEAGGSKATLYRYFDSKEALFEAIIDDIASPAVGAEEGGGDEWEDVALEDGLRELGSLTASAAFDERTIAMLRLALGEHARFPQLARGLFDHGPARTYARMRAFLAAKVDAGDVDIADLQIAAEQFLGGIIGYQQLRMALGMRRLTRAEIAERVEAAIRSFTAAYGTGARRAPSGGGRAPGSGDVELGGVDDESRLASHLPSPG